MSQLQTNYEDGWAPIPFWVLRNHCFESLEQISLYVAIAEKRNTYGYCHPTISLLAHDARCSQSTVRKNLKRFEEIGLIEIRRRTLANGSNLPNEYYVPLFPTIKQKGSVR